MAFPPPTPKQARTLWLSLTALAVGLLIGMLAMLIWGLGWVLNLMSPVLWPVALAGILAYLLDPLVDTLERRKVPRQRAILLVFVGGFLIVAGVVGSVVPRIAHETRDLIAHVPAYTREIQYRVSEWLVRVPWARVKAPAGATNSIVSTNVDDAAPPSVTDTNTPAFLVPLLAQRPGWEKKVAEAAVAWAAKLVPEVGKWILDQVSHLASWAGVVLSLALVPVFTFYFLQEKKAIQKAWTAYLPMQESKLKDELVFVLTAINDYLIVFFRGQVVVSCCKGLMLMVGFLSLGLNYSVLLGLMACVLCIIPYLGAMMTFVPAVILAAVAYKDWLHPLLVLGVFGVAELLEGFVISPKIMGDRVGLHPLTIIIALLVGTTLLGGILGGVLAIPLTAALRVLMFRYVWKKRDA